MTKSPAERTWYCSICDQPFTNDEWLDRHTSADGGDCHEECCDVCPMEDAADLEEQLDALLYRGEAITELVAENAAHVNEANGFDGDEQAAQGCRVRPLAMGCGNGTQWYMWTNASADGYPVWVQNEDCTPFDDESIHGGGHGLGWPDSYRDGYIGD